MQLINKITSWLSGETTLKSSSEDRVLANSDDKGWRIHISEQIGRPAVASSNYLTLFHTVPEVYFPIDFIARRIAGAHFEIKKYSDDSIVYCSNRGSRANRINAILTAPNSIQRFRELVYQHMVYKLATGNAFMRAAMSDAFQNQAKWQFCDNFWSIPSNWMQVVPNGAKVPIFGIAKLDEMVKHYQLTQNGNVLEIVPTYQVWHDRDGVPQFLNVTASHFLKCESRLKAAHKPISNLLAVYEARNVIYVKRGALGFIVAVKEDPTGTVALEPEEKKELVETVNKTHGLDGEKSPWGIIGQPVQFVRTNLSIADLQPFDETLLDAITIAGLYGIPDVLVPRKDHSTFSNQAVAEKSAYCGTIIPMAKQFCEDLTLFLGLDKDGYYVDCNFDDVDCLQVGLKEAEEVKKLVNERCLSQFNNGLITLNDWRAQIHESALDGEIFNKVKFEMTPEELAKVETVIKSSSSTNITFNRGWQGDKGDNSNSNNNKPSTGEESNERNIEENPLSDENG